jgi:predicted secreted protein
MKKIALGFAIACIGVIACAFCGCSTSSGEDATGVNGGFGLTNGIITVAGDAFTVQLDSNPSTGYDWSVSVDGTSVKQAGDSFDQGVSVSDEDSQEATEGDDETTVGQSGVRVLTFEGASAGKSTINLAYAQAGSGDVETTVTINVACASNGAITSIEATDSHGGQGSVKSSK